MRVLHHWPLDPFSRQARLVLDEKSLKHTLQSEAPWEQAAKLQALNPAGNTPVLVDKTTGTPRVIAEARPILEYLEETSPTPCLLPGGPAERAEARRVMDWFDRKYDGEVNAYILHEKLEKVAQGLGSPDPAMLRMGKDHLRWHLDHIAWLLETRDGLAGPRYTLADIVAAAHLSCVDYLGEVPWDDYDVVKHWYQRVKCRPAFRSVLADRLPGTPPSGHYADLDF
ncbi:MAG: glutathione S-transferase family protein [Maricaulis sp.]|jgi:glutathione S-transferase|nr:glutathione S-transferase family protein [Maricaulis sp.]MDG2044854.1 glutathione S-transferase family protein [Maricaulis sp.]